MSSIQEGVTTGASGNPNRTGSDTQRIDWNDPNRGAGSNNDDHGTSGIAIDGLTAPDLQQRISLAEQSRNERFDERGADRTGNNSDNSNDSNDNNDTVNNNDNQQKEDDDGSDRQNNGPHTGPVADPHIGGNDLDKEAHCRHPDNDLVARLTSPNYEHYVEACRRMEEEEVRHQQQQEHQQRRLQLPKGDPESVDFHNDMVLRLTAPNSEVIVQMQAREEELDQLEQQQQDDIMKAQLAEEDLRTGLAQSIQIERARLLTVLSQEEADLVLGIRSLQNEPSLPERQSILDDLVQQTRTLADGDPGGTGGAGTSNDEDNNHTQDLTSTSTRRLPLGQRLQQNQQQQQQQQQQRGDPQSPSPQEGCNLEPGAYAMGGRARSHYTAMAHMSALRDRYLTRRTNEDNSNDDESSGHSNLTDTPIAAAVADELPTTRRDGRFHPTSVQASVVVDDLSEKKRLRAGVCLIIIIAVVASTAVAIALGIVLSRDNEVTTLAPTMTPSASPTLSFEARLPALENLVRATLPPGSQLLDTNGTVQSDAFNWLIQDGWVRQEELAGIAPELDFRIRQRYALACVFLSTSGPTMWEETGSFLSSKSECDWFPTVLCSTNNTVIDINLGA